ncbi:2-succinyl-6-hydroxy-2,4-cyclohexadiene-1-carboxylate synthase [Buttiauxella warmboldiae]|uniref:2-succinyl-6-hydroxy-2,4-cyclohexadiene-1-carboxylate synthase n=1 Tax=Buttiauxella warmboldiae TaxID=82993 RepID=A0A3N5DPA7_9ENTR|nr:2-succinyl-6-hydroxy-2,4-cyclohexadiene-1-carboxylate synthase [Buttiauxella warmboldiae]RPH30474.1 2-succinyl-6-hydroxy-2,4-cyclohexadiene-1-carboxylate synthase [Buttiauxella warmboldiae]
MMLHGVFRAGRDANLPCLVWLHGFLGSQQEWQTLSASFTDWPQLYIDLPGHGKSADIKAESFQQVDALLRETLLSYNILKYWLIGYSLGGRVAMYHACHGEYAGLQGLIVEGGHPGLTDENARCERRISDLRWAQRLRTDPLKAVLTDWYQQAVFQSLNDAQRRELIAVRSQNNAATLAAMLEATSLGNQPDLQAALAQLPLPFYYLCGERDEKFRAVANSLGLTPHLITAAGHNAHREHPAAFSACLLNLLRKPGEDTP